jgi:hypothetical protein
MKCQKFASSSPPNLCLKYVSIHAPLHLTLYSKSSYTHGTHHLYLRSRGVIVPIIKICLAQIHRKKKITQKTQLGLG